ncbi:ectonucleotide pyrophosphatase/phosphodiesterase family member 3 [Sarcophilus harrisii]|uniref:Ectonucleotide pyrophosphatase/phosphodiesterase family member 3 n=1 Tax=Sarcophilus harrisii TaxID=9305 RepID=G3W316_SARHA|nr:ectonucleotide pyrophosphatase/phosphodiesterase family member 3 [Sarcophilus harrisii]XP_031820114.1 ectonucleotide pyrophosphatase/phosphodiesterase family member 3 [Sarcophilus harrisii]
MVESMLALQTEDPVEKSTLKKYKILSGVLLVLLVVVSLGLGLGLGLRRQEQGSCRNKCFEQSYRGFGGCQCDSGCKDRKNCCWDFEETCVESTQIWTCNKFRCGETRLPHSHCSCSDDCLQKKDCCVNYNSICKGESHWVDEECNVSHESQCPEGLPPLILVSMDGFRSEYLHTWSTLMPNINKLKTCGIHSEYMRPVYPTKTFPNHYTIVTGLYPESHGIIDNNMYDVYLNKNFSLSSKEILNPKWWYGQPIWLTAIYQGLKAGTFFWPGSEVSINGTFPTYYKMFNNSIPYEERITTLLHWLDLPKSERPNFYTLYVEEPDSAGHKSGPVSGDVIKALQKVDKAFGMLMEGLKQRNLHNCVNVILLADHGMEWTYCNKVEYMIDYFPEINFYMYEGPAPRIRTRNIPTDYFTFDSPGIVRNLSCRKADQHFKPYLTPDLPKRLHYAKNVRIEKVHLLVDQQWLVVRYKNYKRCAGGTHGYDNEFKSMEAIFLAHGPGFKEKVKVEPFENIELYNLMCDLLHIQPAPNNGTHGSLNHLLKQPFHIPSHPKEVSTLYSCPFVNAKPTDNLNCICDLLDQNAQIEKNQNLNLTSKEETESAKENLPYGRPRITQRSKNYCLLYQKGYISGYSQEIHMPLWTSYTISKPGDTSPLPPTVPDCLRADVRISPSQSQNCSIYSTEKNITHGFLYPPMFNKTSDGQYDALLTSNLVPTYKAFKQMWDYFHHVMLVTYATKRNGVNVISGPVFDYNYDGRSDEPHEITEFISNTGIPIPTHYFVVLSSCKNQTYTPLNCPGSLDVLPFIIPHRSTNIESCPANRPENLWIEERFRAHTARVRDVELLTGLDFYQDRDQAVSEILQLKTFLPIFEMP